MLGAHFFDRDLFDHGLTVSLNARLSAKTVGLVQSTGHDPDGD